MKSAIRNKKGFTLVEIIVVLVILAIMASILVPSLTGYIDRARMMKDIIPAKRAMTAMQSVISTMYAKGEDPWLGQSALNYNDVSWVDTPQAEEIMKLAECNPYILIIGLGDSNENEEVMGDDGKVDKNQGVGGAVDFKKAHKVYFAAYVADEGSMPIFFNGNEWVTKYPWINHGYNTFLINGEWLNIQFYIIESPVKGHTSSDISDTWTKLQDLTRKHGGL